MTKKARNIISLIVSACAFGLIAAMGTILINKANHNKQLQEEKEKIIQDLANPDQDIYDIYNVDNYTVYDEQTIIEFSK